MLRRLGFVLVAFAAVSALAYLIDVQVLFQPGALLARKDALRAWVEAEPLIAPLAFAAFYSVVVSSGLPLGPPMGLLAGFLFGRWLGTALILVAATTGALVVHAIARRSLGTALGARLRARAGPFYDRVAAELGRNAFSYVVSMRLVPMFPFFLVNVVAGLFRVPARTFALATLLGRVPGTFLYVSLGQEVGRIERPEDLISPTSLAALTGLGLLALGPTLVRHLRNRRPRTPDPDRR